MKTNFNNIISASLDCISRFNSSFYPLKNIAKEISTNRKLNSKERKQFFDLVFLWSREYYLIKNYLNEKETFFSMLDVNEQQEIIVKILFSEIIKEENKFSEIYKNYEEYKNKLGDEKYSLMLDKKLYTLLKNAYKDLAPKIIKSIFSKPKAFFAVENPEQNIIKVSRWLSENNIEHDFSDLVDSAISINTHVNLEKIPKPLRDQVWSMDLASQFIASLITPLPHEKVLDLCGGKGVKARFLSFYCNDLTFVEVDKKRIEFAKKWLPRKKIKFLCEDARKLNLPDNSFDWILLDAPCSGTGTIRRHPDIIHRWKKVFNEKMLKLQSDLLSSAFKLLKPGGKLMYVTCSILREENQEQIKNILSLHKDARLIEIDFLKDKFVQKNEYGYNLFPHFYDSDGFFISCLTKF